MANPPIQIYPNKTKSRIVLKVKTGNKLELLSSKTMKLLQKKRHKKKIEKMYQNKYLLKLF